MKSVEKTRKLKANPKVKKNNRKRLDDFLSNFQIDMQFLKFSLNFFDWNQVVRL
jgi:hypothetical protein